MAGNIKKKFESIDDTAHIADLETRAHVIKDRLDEALKNCPIRIGSKRKLEVDRIRR